MRHRLGGEINSPPKTLACAAPVTTTRAHQDNRRAAAMRRSPRQVAVLAGRRRRAHGPLSRGDWCKRVNLCGWCARVPAQGKPGVGGESRGELKTRSVVMNERTIDRASLRLPAVLLLAGQVLYIVITQFHPDGVAND